MPIDSDQQFLCAKCVGNNTFKKWIRDHGTRGQCDFDTEHGNRGKVVSIEEFSGEVDTYFRNIYQIGEQYSFITAPSGDVDFDQRGEPYKEILQNDIDCSDKIIEAIDEQISGICHVEYIGSGDCFYKDDECYEPISDAQKRTDDEMMEYWYENRISYQWEDFTKTIQFERRFFRIKELLDELLGSHEEYQKTKISPIYNLSCGTKIFRARIQRNNFKRNDIISNPSVVLGAPPSEMTKAGRMNVEFIPAFYAAFNEDTAIAEMRPSINDYVVIGEFQLAKDISVFDFTVFDKPPEDGVHFHRHSRYDVITQLQSEISKPISPNERQREYIPTQAVAEYLKEYFNCEAVIYKSSVHKNDTAENRNIVLLNKGIPFSGDAKSPLSYLRYKTVIVHNVTYQIKKKKF